MKFEIFKDLIHCYRQKLGNFEGGLIADKILENSTIRGRYSRVIIFYYT